MYPYIHIRVYRKRYKEQEMRNVDIQVGQHMHLMVFV